MRKKTYLLIILFFTVSYTSSAQSVEDLYQLRVELQSNIDDLTNQLARINLKIKEIELENANQSQQSYERPTTSTYSSLKENRSVTASVASTRSNFDDNYSCNTLMKTEEDKFTGKLLTSMAEGIVVSSDSKNGFGINLFSREDSKVIFLSIRTVGAGNCVRERDRIYINFLDGSKMELAHMGDFDCDATSLVYFGGMYGGRKNLGELANKRVSAMRVWVGDSYVDQEFTEENSLALMNAVKCLY